MMQKVKSKWAFLFISIFILKINITSVLAQNAVSIVKDIKGDAWLITDQNKEKIKVTDMLELKEGDTLKIDSGSAVTVRYYDSTVEEKYLENSMIEIGRERGIVHKGKAEPVNKTFQGRQTLTNSTENVPEERYVKPAPELNSRTKPEVQQPTLFDVLILSFGDTDRRKTVKMIVGEELGKNKDFHLVDINEIPDFTTRYNYGIDSFEIEELSRIIRTIKNAPVPHIIVKANIKTIGQTRLKFYDRYETLYTTSVSLEAILTQNSHVIAGPLVKEVKFTDLNMFDNITNVTQPMSETLSNQIESFVKSFK
ncbi:MAG: hypothetical protein V3V70_03935 [Candidatus Scalindua sp.]